MQASLDEYSVVRHSFDEVLVWYEALRRERDELKAPPIPEPPPAAERIEDVSLSTDQDRAEQNDYPDGFSDDDDITERQELQAALDERSEELAVANETIAELNKRLAQLDPPPTPLPPDPQEAKLSDYGAVGAVEPILTPKEAEVEADRLFSNFKDGFDVGDEISGLSEVRREDLTAALNRRKSKMRRERLDGALPDQKEEAAIDTLVNLLARRGV